MNAKPTTSLELVAREARCTICVVVTALADVAEVRGLQDIDCRVSGVKVDEVLWGCVTSLQSLNELLAKACEKPREQ